MSKYTIERMELLKSLGGACKICNSEDIKNLEIHHINPEKITLLCHDCHRKIVHNGNFKKEFKKKDTRKVIHETKKLMLLTKREQELGLEMLSSDINKKTQTKYISHAFYSTICKMKKLGLIKSLKRGRTCDYSLTDDGRILFSVISKFVGNEDFDKFSIKGTRIISFS